MSFTDDASADTVTVTAPIDISFVHDVFVAAGYGEDLHVVCHADDAPAPEEYDLRGWEIEVEKDGEPALRGEVGEMKDDSPHFVTYLVPRDSLVEV